MRRRVITGAVALSVVLAVALVACGPSKPTGSEYLGKWEGTIETLTGNEGPCHLDISKVGDSYVIKSERQTVGNCVFYEGIATLTPEGNLRRGSGLGEMVISFDKDKSQAIVSGGGKLRHLTRGDAAPAQDQNPPSKVQPQAAAQQSPTPTVSRKDAIFERLVGKWDGHTIYYDTQERKYKQGAEQHCEFVRDRKGVKFIGENGQVLAEDNAYLTYSGGKLYGSYQAGKHGGAHGQLWTQKFTLELRDDNTLLFDDSTWKHEYRKR